MERNAAFYLHILSRLLLEVRNLEEADLMLAPKLAYIFHNVPALIDSHFAGTDGDEAWEVIRARARQAKLENWLTEWEQNAFARMKQSPERAP